MSDFERCPCCALPTLDERGAAEICPVCWWEDNERDERADDAALSRARENYTDHFDRFDPGQGPPVVADPSSARRMLLAYLASVQNGESGYDDRKLHGLLRGLSHGA